ncbi:hypothetical protein ONZ45_g12430 [Pleurotus djamor]|nr:hypothetical protein ONZ45_g12430 [Pleurotus djamor]
MVKYRCLEKSLRDVVFVDTPGFDHAGVDGRVLTDRSIVEMLLDWMKKTTGLKIKITAILYFHRISDNRMGAAPIRHLRILRKLCGDDALRRVILTTTMWDLEVPSTCYQREEELKREPDFWKTTLDHGATVARHHHTEDSAWNIIDSINRAHHGDWKEELEAELDKLQREIGLKVVNLRLAAYNLRDKLEEIRRGHREGETESYLQRRREEYEALRRDYEQEFNNLAKHKAKPGFCLKRLSSSAGARDLLRFRRFRDWFHLKSVNHYAAIQTLCALVLAQSGPSNWTTTPFSPSALPLAVRSPYLNVWLPQGNNPQAVYGVENRIWDYSQSVQWYASAAVDGTEYRLFCPWATGEKLPSQTAAEFTATRTSFLLEVGGVRFNMSFLSPIEPTDMKLQSLPFVYLYITAESIDGNSHKVLLYSDIEPNIVAGDVHQTVTWAVDDTTDYVVLSTRLQQQRPFVESFTQAQDGEALYAFKKVPGLKTAYKIFGFNDVRGRIFSTGGTKPLDNTAETDFRAPASGDNTPVLGISLDLGNITTITEPAVWTLGFFRSTSILAKASAGSSLEQRSAYFRSSIDDPVSAAKFVLDDFPRALTSADALDNKIKLAGSAISPEYAGLLALSARQAMSAMEITLPEPATPGGSWNKADVKAYMKNIGAGTEVNGNPTSSVNDVGVLYASFPVFLYLNPEIGRYLLAPLLEYQASSDFALSYAVRHLGTVYPNAIADTSNNEHQFGVDESASMIIMSLAYTLASGNASLINEHYDLFKRWGTYLEENAITPNNQASGDFNGQTPANQTNLALKGIIAIGAMAKMSEVVGNRTDQERFNSTAQDAITLWRSQSISPSSSSGIAETYGNHSGGGGGLVYNLYADKLLRLGLVPKDVYDVCTTAYQAASSSFKYGLPISPSFAQNTSTSSMLFAASTATNPITRDALVAQVHAYASNNMNNAPFASMYDPSTGMSANDKGGGSGRASPAQGGIFALLALEHGLLAAEASSQPRLWCSSDASKRLEEWTLPDSGPVERTENLPALNPQHASPVFWNTLWNTWMHTVRRESSRLVDALSLWAHSRTKSSDLYIELGNHITDVVEAFSSLHVDMSPLRDVKDGLRQVLETCLALDAVPEDIELYLPVIREMLTKVIQVGQPVYHTSQQAFGVERINVIIQANNTVTPSGMQVSSSEVLLDLPGNGSSTCESRDQSDEAHFICIPSIDSMHRSARSLLRNLEEWGYWRNLISYSFVQLGNEYNGIMENEVMRSADFDESNLCSNLEGLRAVLRVCLAEGAIPENINSYLPDVLRMTTKLSQELAQMRAVLSVPKRKRGIMPDFSPSTPSLDDNLPTLYGCHYDMYIAGDSPRPKMMKMGKPPSIGSLDDNVLKLHGRHVHLVAGNGRPRIKPRPPPTLQTDEVHVTQAN